MVSEIPVATLRNWRQDEESLCILDIRTRAEYDLGHIPESRNVPMDQLIAGIESIEPSSRIVLVCEVGELSVKAGRLIEAYDGIDEGQTVASLEGGYRAWCERHQE
ncbi:MAG: rhodanese-like domain-containing protein [Halodesulfurarchaeum sp.]